MVEQNETTCKLTSTGSLLLLLYFRVAGASDGQTIDIGNENNSKRKQNWVRPGLHTTQEAYSKLYLLRRPSYIGNGVPAVYVNLLTTTKYRYR